MKIQSFSAVFKTALCISILLIIPNLAFAQKPGAFYFGDSDQNGIIEVPDLIALTTVLGNFANDDTVNYNGYPQSRYRQDLDGNGIIEIPDLIVLTGWVSGDFSTRPGSPDRVMLDADSVTVLPGVSVEVSAYALSPVSAGSQVRTGFGIIFKIDPSSTCTTAQIKGYDVAGGATVNAWRSNAAYHYTLQPGAPDNGRAKVQVNTNGCEYGSRVKLEVYIPDDDEAGVVPGRFPAKIAAGQFLKVTAATDDSYEENDTPGSAANISAPIVLPIGVSGCLHAVAVDNDYYNFTFGNYYNSAAFSLSSPNPSGNIDLCVRCSASSWQCSTNPGNNEAVTLFGSGLCTTDQSASISVTLVSGSDILYDLCWNVVSSCGDSYCSYQKNENSSNCPWDCACTCGDGFCENHTGSQPNNFCAENNPLTYTAYYFPMCDYPVPPNYCPADCGCGHSSCGDGYCDSYCGETSSNCVQDCACVCGDGVCSKNCTYCHGLAVNCSCNERSASGPGYCPADCP